MRGELPRPRGGASRPTPMVRTVRLPPAVPRRSPACMGTLGPIVGEETCTHGIGGRASVRQHVLFDPRDPESALSRAARHGGQTKLVSVCQS